MKNMALAALIVFLLGCQSQPVHTIPESPDLSTWQERVQQNPQDWEAHAKLADEYFALSQQEHVSQNISSQKMTQAVFHYEKLLKQNPKHVAILLRIYPYHYQRTLQGHPDSTKRLAEIFDDLPIQAREELIPPHTAKFLFALSQEKPASLETLTELSGLLKKAIIEQPKASVNYVLLANLYQQYKRDRLALSTLKRGLEKQPDDALLLKHIGHVYKDRALSQVCENQQQEDFSEAQSLYLQALPQIPQDEELRQQLHLILWYQGHRELAIDQAQFLNKHFPSSQNQVRLATSLFHHGYIDQAIQVLNHPGRSENTLLKEDLSAIESNLGLLNFAQGNWQQAIQHFEHPIHQQQPLDYYHHVLLFLAKKQMVRTEQHIGESQDQALETFQQTTEDVTLNAWEKHLHHFLTQQKTPDTLLPKANNLLLKANNLCEQTEAHFYIGYQHYLQGNLTTAEQHFKRVRENKIYASLEYGMAQYILTQLDQSQLKSS